MKGLCVVKMAIGQVKSQKNMDKFKMLIVKHRMNLIHSSFGNYVIQMAIDVKK